MNKKIFISMILASMISMGVQARDVYLHSSFSTWKENEETDEFKFQPVGDSENHFVLYVTVPAITDSKNPNKIKVYDKVEDGEKNRGSADSSDKELDLLNGTIKALNSYKGSGNESSVTISNTIALRVRFEYWAKYKFSGDTDDNYHSALKATICPDYLYLYGHLQGKDWNNDRMYVAECDGGIYSFTDVNISGRAGNENYIAFFGEKPTTSNYASLYPRYGGSSSDRNIDTEHSNGYNTVILESDFTSENNNTVSKGIDVLLSKPSYDSNFRLHDGMYDVTVNLVDGKVTFTKINLSYQWHDANGNPIEENPTFYIQDNPRLQISCRNDLDHDAASKVSFDITYVSDSQPEPETIALYDISNGDDSAYEIEDGYILLKKTGTYTVKASLPDEYSSLYMGLQPVSITAVVKDVPTSIEGITGYGGVKEYFGIDGTKLREPQKGLYIEKENGKTRLILKR